MSEKNGKDYLYLVWKCASNRRQYIVGQLSKNGQYEFCYGKEFDEAVENGFAPLISFKETNRVYKSAELFPAFSSRLPDRKRKDIDKILERYGLDTYDAYELLKRSGAKLPIDNLQFIDPILDFQESFEKSFYVAGARHYLNCEGSDCAESIEVLPDEKVILKRESDNAYDEYAVQVYNLKKQLLGYIPRYYSQAFTKFIAENRIDRGVILNVDKNGDCDECIKIKVYISKLKR